MKTGSSTPILGMSTFPYFVDTAILPSLSYIRLATPAVYSRNSFLIISDKFNPDDAFVLQRFERIIDPVPGDV